MASLLPRALAATCLGFCALRCSSQSLPEPCGTRSVPLYGNIGEDGYYYADLLVGNPPQRSNAIVDTTSHLLSLSCAPCAACGHHLDPSFVPSASRGARWTSCGPACPGTCVYAGPSRREMCRYNQSFQEGSAIRARFLRDEVALAGAQQPMQPPFGRPWGRIGARTTDIACHEFEGGLFRKQKANGLLGLGPGRPLSDLLLSARPCPGTPDEQLYGSYSMCLSESGGQLEFPAVLLMNTQWIAMLPGAPNHLPLEAIHVEGSHGELEASIPLTHPGVRRQPTRAHVDSGTTYVYLPQRAYFALRSAIRRICGRRNPGCGGAVRRGTRCWYLPHGPQGLKRFPRIQFQFQQQRLMWMPYSYMVREGKEGSSTYCYGFDGDGPASSAVLGLTFFLRRQIVFDMPRRRLGFRDSSCPQYKERPHRSAAVPAPLPQFLNATSYFPEAVETTTYRPYSQFPRHFTTTEHRPVYQTMPYAGGERISYQEAEKRYRNEFGGGGAVRQRSSGGSGFGVLPPTVVPLPIPPMPRVPVPPPAPAPRIPTPLLRAPWRQGSHSKQRAEVVLEKVKEVEDVVEAVLNDSVTQSLGQHLGPLLHRLPRWGSRAAADGGDEADGAEDTEEPEPAEEDEEEDDEGSPEGNLMLIGFAAAGGALLTALFCAGVAFGALGHARMARSGARELRDALLQTGEVEAPPPPSLGTEMEAVLPKPFTAPLRVPASSEPASAEDGVL